MRTTKHEEPDRVRRKECQESVVKHSEVLDGARVYEELKNRYTVLVRDEEVY